MKEFRDIGVKSWMIYVDDTFVIVESRDNVEKILFMLKNLHKKITFLL